MTSELRPAVEVATNCYEQEFFGIEAAAAVIEADREAVRAEMSDAVVTAVSTAAETVTAALEELAKFKALAETLAGALEAIRSEAQREEGSWLHLKRCIAAQSAEALLQYKEARDVAD